jgi:hypothetical protein
MLKSGSPVLLAERKLMIFTTPPIGDLKSSTTPPTACSASLT